DSAGDEHPTQAIVQGIPVLATGQLPPPNSLATVTATGGTVSLNWNGSPGAASYRVLQSSTPNGSFAQAIGGATNGTSTTITGLSANTPYYFQVIALDNLGNSSLPSNVVTAPTTGSVGAPAGLSVTAATSKSATLTWAAAPGSVSYYVL